MKEKYIALLQKQIEKLDDSGFDLEAWKTGAIAVISRTFGSTDARIQQLEQLKIDYSSWALRDSSSSYKPEETAKKKGRELLTTAVEEIDIFGGPDDKSSLIAAGLTEDIQNMTEKEKADYFKAMKKEKLIEMILKLT